MFVKAHEGERIMKTNLKLALAVVAGVLIGVAGAGRAIHAQQPKAPPAYVIAELEVTDPTTLSKYAEKVPETLAGQFFEPLEPAHRPATGQAKEPAPAGAMKEPLPKDSASRV